MRIIYPHKNGSWAKSSILCLEEIIEFEWSTSKQQKELYVALSTDLLYYVHLESVLSMVVVNKKSM